MRGNAGRRRWRARSRWTRGSMPPPFRRPHHRQDEQRHDDRTSYTLHDAGGPAGVVRHRKPRRRPGPAEPPHEAIAREQRPQPGSGSARRSRVFPSEKGPSPPACPPEEGRLGREGKREEGHAPNDRVEPSDAQRRDSRNVGSDRPQARSRGLADALGGREFGEHVREHARCHGKTARGPAFDDILPRNCGAPFSRREGRSGSQAETRPNPRRAWTPHAT